MTTLELIAIACASVFAIIAFALFVAGRLERESLLRRWRETEANEREQRRRLRVIFDDAEGRN
jgi:hypothetical protein